MSSFAALAAIWCSPTTTTTSPEHPSSTTKKNTTMTTTTTGAADVLPVRRRVDRSPIDGSALPPLTRSESALVAVFLTIWCGMPFLVTGLGLASLVSLCLGQWRLALFSLSINALLFATKLIPCKDGPSSRVRSSKLLSLIRRYFDYSVACEGSLDPDRPYLFASYPHGTYPLAPLLGMTVHKAAGWGGKGFVGGAASSVFFVPLWRQGLSLIGCVPADRATLLKALREGSSVGLCPGGISEMYRYGADEDARLLAAGRLTSSSSGGGGGGNGKGSGGGKGGGSKGGGSSNDAANEDADPLFGAIAVSKFEHAVLMERRGFVALAVEAGVDIVPVYYFSNSLLFSFGPRWLERLGRRLKVSLGLLIGAHGLPLPHRVPLMQAVGRPVPVPRAGKDGAPLVRGTPEFEKVVDEVHEAYRVALLRTYDCFKPVYNGGPLWRRRRLIIH